MYTCLNYYILSFLLFIQILPVSGQDWDVNMVNETKNKSCFNFDQKCLEKGDYDKLKASKLYFVLPKYLADEVETYQELLSKVWKINELIVITPEEYDVVKNDINTAFFMIRYNLYYIGSQMYRFGDVRLELTMQRNQDGKRDYSDAIRYALIYLVHDKKTEYLTNENWHENKKENKIRTYNNHIFSHAIFLNFKPNLMANYLESISTHLKDRTTPTNKKDDKELAVLTDDTLFITNNFLIKEIKYNAKKKKYITKKYKEKKILRSYPYAYKFISFDELETKISTGEVFLYAMCSAKRGYAIFKSTSGEMITESNIDGTTRQNIKFNLRHLKREIKRSNRSLKNS